MGSRDLSKLRHSLAHFDQIRIILGLILVNPEWRWFLKRKILHLKIWNHISIPSRELYTWAWLRAKTCSYWAPFSELWVILGPSLTNPERRLFERSGIMGFKNTKYFFDAHLRDASGFPSARKGQAFFCAFRSNSYRLRVDSGQPRMKVIFERNNSSFANMKSYLDTHLRVVHMVLIASEDM